METSLPLSLENDDGDGSGEGAGTGGGGTALFIQEAKRQGYLAGPMVAVTLSQYLLLLITTLMAGHLNELALSSTAMAISLSSVTGFSFLIGMSSALETLCGQAYGGQQYQRVGNQTNTGIFCLICVSIPLSLLWIQMEKFLLLIGQDPQISKEAGKFMTCLIPALFGFSTLQPLVRFFQIQSLIMPLLVTSSISILIHVPLCWVLVFKSRLHNIGAALAVDISIWVNVISLGLYMRCSSSCDETRAPITMELFKGIPKFLRFAVPSAFMVCLEWWSYEMLILLSGLLPNPQLETSVLSVCLNTITTIYAIPNGLGAAASTRVSNELGAGKPKAARLAAFTVVVLAVSQAVIVSAALFGSREVFGYVFSNEKEVVDRVTAMAPLVCASVILDSLQGALSGIATGCGWQHIAALVNFAAFYLCGIPIAATLAFVVKMKGLGLWIGIQSGALIQITLFSIVTFCINWEHQCRKAREKLS